MVWKPQKGAQASFISADWCQEIFYGGERGGGKSDCQLGYQEDAALRYDGKSRGIMFRKTYAELEELQARAVEIFSASGAVYKSAPSASYPHSNCWFFPNGATIKMRYIENEKDYGRYHGHSYCVGVDTDILMGDGSYKKIIDIKIGDSVMTLEGEKRVTDKITPYLAKCVSATTRLGYQIQPFWHPLLTNVESFFESQPDEYRTDEQLRRKNDPWQSYESLLSQNPDNQGLLSYLKDGQIDYKGVEDGNLKSLPPLWSSCLLVHQLPAPQLYQDLFAKLHRGLCIFGGLNAVKRLLFQPLTSLGFLRNQELDESTQDHEHIFSFFFPCSHGKYDVLATPLIQGFQCGYQPERRLNDGRPLFFSRIARYAAPLLAYVAKLIRDVTNLDEKDYTRVNNRQVLYKYIHPYTKEQRQGVVPLTGGMVYYQYVGESLVCDLTVEDANHYITKCGLINKNSHLSADEVTEYSTPNGILKMYSTLRNAYGVPCSVRLTGNPGGVGHGWVKKRFIDGKRPFTPYVDPDSGMMQMFIPSKTSDNQILLSSDPLYRERIKAATGGNDALRKAWLDGDWDIVAGAFFECWDRKRHVIKPFEIPEQWMKFRSGDWGSARPFAFHWFAVVTDDYRLDNGLVLKRGALVCYREWYGMEKDKYNVGLKMTAEAVGAGIWQREQKDSVSYGVLDPAAFSQDGGESIHERMRKGSGNNVVFKRADNSRVSKRGNMGGWDVMRARLIGSDESEPMLVFFDTCEHAIRTIPLLQHDKTNIEDIDTDMEDHCFAAGTMVWTKNGLLPIESLPESGVVMTPNGYESYRSARLVKKNAEIVKLTFDDGTVIKCTPDHKFIVDMNDMEAKDLYDVVLKKHDGLFTKCIIVEPIPNEDVYCITVPKTGYFIIENGVAVSNCGDSVRYACMSRPWVRPQTIIEPPKFATQMTFNELLQQSRRERS